jgi:hypothetical protein
MTADKTIVMRKPTKGATQTKRVASSTIRTIAVPLALLLLLVAITRIRTERARRSSAASAHPQLLGLTDFGIAVADFTGDGNPDLATVVPDRFQSTAAQYVVEVQLSEGGHQFLRMTAPFGGLRITAKDLTGDGNLDLVVHVGRSPVPAAVLLNDGHGHFSPAEPSAFARVASGDTPGPEFTAKHFCFGATPASSESRTVGLRSAFDRNPPAPRCSLFPTHRRMLIASSFFFDAGRAPPSAV